MNEIQSYFPNISNIPTTLQTKIASLTTSIPITISVASTISQEYATITSILSEAVEQQESVFSALNVVTNSASIKNLVNVLSKAEATANYYSILEVAATETNGAAISSLMTQAAKASNDMVLFGPQQNTRDLDLFAMQLFHLTIALCFLLPVIYYIIGQLPLIFGQQFLIFKTMNFSPIFIALGSLSIILQLLGGYEVVTKQCFYSSSQTGTNIMIVGLTLQLFTIFFFLTFWFLFLWKVYQSKREYGYKRYLENYPHLKANKNMMIHFVFPVLLALFLVFIRSIYRIFEINSGFFSNLALEKIYFMIDEDFLMSITVVIFLNFSPGFVYGTGIL